jgi:hypothetical protein
VNGVQYGPADRQTNRQGEYYFEHLSAGTYRILFIAPNNFYVSEYYREAYTVEDSDLVEVRAKQVVRNIDASLKTLGSIKGRVTNLQGEPLAGVRVTAVDVPTTIMQIQDVTDENGEYWLTWLNAADYQVGFNGSAIGYNAELYDDATTVEGRTLVPVQIGETVNNIDAALSRRSSISGCISGIGGMPLDGFSILLWRLLTDRNLWVIESPFNFGDVDGKFHIPNLAPGTYRLSFMLAVPVPYLSEFFDDAVNEGDATSILIEPETNVYGIGVELAPVTPVAPTPAPPANSVHIVPGRSTERTFNTGGGQSVGLKIPPCAVSHPMLVSFKSVTGFPPATDGFGVGPFHFLLEVTEDSATQHDFALENPAELLVSYIDADVAGLAEDDLTLAYFNETRGVWSSEGVTVLERNLHANQLRVRVHNLRHYGLVAEKHTTLLPVIRQ